MHFLQHLLSRQCNQYLTFTSNDLQILTRLWFVINDFYLKKENTWKSINLQKAALSWIWILFKTVKKCITINDEKVILHEKDHKKHQKLWALPWSNLTLSLYYWNIASTFRLYFLNPQGFTLPFFCLPLPHCGVRHGHEITKLCGGSAERGSTPTTTVQSHCWFFLLPLYSWNTPQLQPWENNYIKNFS